MIEFQYVIRDAVVGGYYLPVCHKKYATMSWKIATNRLLYFAKVGEIVTVSKTDFHKIWRQIKENNRKRRFKYDKIGENYIIWRNK